MTSVAASMRFPYGRPLHVISLLAAIVCTPSTFASEDDEKTSTSASASCEQHGHEMLNSVLWQQTSAEYLALTKQTFWLARASLDRALGDRNWTAALEQTDNFEDLSPAVILDLDETVLNNVRYEARIVLEYGSYSRASFQDWCDEGGTSSVPQARAFLDYVQSRGVTIFYYSSRPEELRACTTKSLERLGMPIEPEFNTILLNDGSTKSLQRERVGKKFRILLLLGDNLEDFVTGSKDGAEARKALVQEYAEYWGSKWIILPNPMYGHWEATFYDFDYGLPSSERLRRKCSGLNK